MNDDNIGRLVKVVEDVIAELAALKAAVAAIEGRLKVAEDAVKRTHGRGAGFHGGLPPTV